MCMYSFLVMNQKSTYIFENYSKDDGLTKMSMHVLSQNHGRVSNYSQPTILMATILNL